MKTATPEQSRVMAIIFGGHAVLKSPATPVIATRHGFDGKNIVCHRVTPTGTDMFRIAPDGTVTQH